MFQLYLLWTVNACSVITGLLSWLENTLDLQLYWPRSELFRLGRRKTASAELTPRPEASCLPAGSSSSVSTVAERLAGTDTSHDAVNGWPSVGELVVVMFRSEKSEIPPMNPI